MGRRVLLGLFAASVLFSCEKESIPTTNDEHNQMLGDLGFTTDLGARLDPADASVPDDYHPLKKKFASFHTKYELYLGGITLDGKKENLYDDGAHGWAPLPFTGKTDTAWTGALFRDGVGGDFDGDGFDEVFLVYFVDATKVLSFIYLDLNGGTVKEGDLDGATSAELLQSIVQPSLAAGDLDGDGRDEVAVGFKGTFYLVDGLEGTPVVTRKTFPGQDRDDCFVAMGNIDWDGADELAVTYTTTTVGNRVGRYAIFDGDFTAPVQQGLLTFAVNDVVYVSRETQVAIGDVDGDRLGEIVFAGITQGDLWAMFILEYQQPGASPLYDWRRFLYRPGWTSASVPYPLVPVDWDGDGKKEVLFDYAILKVTSDAAPTVINGNIPNLPERVAAADVDGDGREEVLEPYGNSVYVKGVDALGHNVDKKVWAGPLTNGSANAIVVPVNVDRDSAIVRYDGQHELLFTQPHLMAVLASPPYKDGIGQNVDATTSTFGKSTSNAVEHETSLGFTTGFSVGYEADFSFFGGVEFKASVEQSLDFISSQSISVTKDVAYTTGPGEDKVVFTTIPFDVYYYTIVSTPEPDAGVVGQTVTINIPREPQTLATSVSFYNSHNGGAQDVGKDILRHTPGNLWSYPTPSDRDLLLTEAASAEPGYQKLWNGPRSVNEGNGYITLGISRTEGSARGAAMDFAVNFEFESTSPGGAKFGSSVGFHYGHTCSYSTEETATFQGSVGDIPEAAFTSANRYKFGLFVYPRTAGGDKFLVMNYWTEE